MKFTVPTQDLQSALEKIRRIPKRRFGGGDDIKIQASVQPLAEDQNLSILAHNVDTTSISKLIAQVDTPGTMVVSAETLISMTKACQDEDITIECDGRMMTISYMTDNSESRFEIATSDPELYADAPNLDRPYFAVSLEKAATFKAMIAACLSAPAGTNEKRPFVSGVRIEMSEKAIRMVSTNSARLLYIDAPVDACAEMAYGDVDTKLKNVAGLTPIVPKYSLDEIQKSFFDDARLTLSITDRFLVLSQDDEQINIRLLDGEFPPYEKVTSTDKMQAINIDADVLAGSMSRATLILNQNNMATAFEFSKDTLKIEHKNPTVGTFSEQMRIDYDGPDVSLFMNPAAIIKAVKAINAKDMLLFVGHEIPRIILKPKGSETPLYVLMGMQG